MSSSRVGLTETTQKIAQTEIVVDKLHMAGHVDTWCRQTCDPHLFSALDNVSSLTSAMLVVDSIASIHMYMYMCMCDVDVEHTVTEA